MLKMIIADDEPFIREGLMELVDWHTLGFIISEVAVDGDDALEKIIKHQPHVVLIDIKMPGLTGIDVIREVKNQDLNCQFIVLSGYSDFEYAKASIHLNVFDYLLKPITEQELIRVMKNVHQKILTQQQTTEKLHLYQQFEQETALKKMLSGELSHEVSENGKKYQIGFTTDTSRKGDWVPHLIQQMPGIHVLDISEGIVLFFEDTDQGKIRAMLRHLTKRYQFKLALSGPDLSITQVAQAYVALKKCEARLFCFRDETLLLEEMIPKTIKQDIDIAQLYLAIEFSDQDMLTQLGIELEQYYQSMEATAEQIKGRLSHFQTLLLQKFADAYGALHVFKDEQMLPQYQNQESLQDILAIMLTQWDMISLAIKKEIDFSDDGVKKVQHYVKRYYHQDLSLKIVSKILNYNATYLGKKFKLETGETFSKYVDRIRIEKAQGFLGRDKMKVYEVAERVGYCNIDYFYRKFKNHTGKSPKEWQKEYLEKHGNRRDLKNE